MGIKTFQRPYASLRIIIFIKESDIYKNNYYVRFERQINFLRGRR